LRDAVGAGRNLSVHLEGGRMTGRTAPKETVFIVDDDLAIREGLCDLLESAGMETRHFATAEDFLRNYRAQTAGCLVLDVRLPGMSGTELQGKLVELGLTIPVIIMTAHGDMPMVRKVLKSGAVDFLIKPFQDEELLQTVERAIELDRSQRRNETLLSSIQARAQTLTEREREIMELVTTGLTNREIAQKLHLSVVTIKLHRGQVMRKMQADSLADLVKMSEKMNMPDESRNSGS
jgi:FixJ family two-component response regulator